VAEDARKQGSPSLKARTVRGTLVTVAGTGFSRLLALGSNIVLSRLLFPEAFGVMALVIMLMTGLQMISDVDIQPSVIQHKRGNEPAFLDTAFTIQALRGIVIWLVAAAGAVPFAQLYGDERLVWLVPAVLASALLAGGFSTKLITLNRNLALGRLMLIDLGARVAAVTAMITFAAIYRSIWALVIGGLVENAVRLAASHLAIPGRNNRLRWDREAARDIFHFGKWIFVSTLITFLATRLDVMLLGKLVSLELLGVYSIALTLGRNLNQVTSKVTSMVLLPAFSSSAREGPEVLAQAFARGRRSLLPLGFAVFLGAALGAPAFFYFVYDERYRAAGWMAQLAMATLWLNFLQDSSSRALLALGDARSLAAANTLKLVVTAGLSIGGYMLGGFPFFLVGVAAGAAVGHAVIIVALATHGLHSLKADLAYTFAGVAIALGSWQTSDLAARAAGLADAAPISLGFALLVLVPYGFWVLRRVKDELRR
jgi:O-antigen/teichoic acid export membrane protein